MLGCDDAQIQWTPEREEEAGGLVDDAIVLVDQMAQAPGTIQVDPTQELFDAASVAQYAKDGAQNYIIVDAPIPMPSLSMLTGVRTREEVVQRAHGVRAFYWRISLLRADRDGYELYVREGELNPSYDDDTHDHLAHSFECMRTALSRPFFETMSGVAP